MVRCTWDRIDIQVAEQTAHPTAVRGGGRVLPQIAVLKSAKSPQKAASNLKDHGVSFEEAITVFGDLLSMNMPDPNHSEGEQRFVVLGNSARSRLVVVSYTERPPRTRIISARVATRQEKRQYEEH